MNKEKLKECLNQLADLRKEIKKLEKKIKKTEPKALVSDKVQGSSKYFPYSKINFEISAIDNRYQLRLMHYKGLLNRRLEKCLEQEIETTQFINQIEDSKLRQIFEHRYIDQYSWTKIGFIVGGTGDSIRMKHDRFLEKIQ